MRRAILLKKKELAEKKKMRKNRFSIILNFHLEFIVLNRYLPVGKITPQRPSCICIFILYRIFGIEIDGFPLVVIAVDAE